MIIGIEKSGKIIEN